jgi:hypothetical protein
MAIREGMTGEDTGERLTMGSVAYFFQKLSAYV